MKEIRIPFSGFYNSLWSDAIDREEESHIDHMIDEDGCALDKADLADVFFKNTKYQAAYEAVAKKYLDAYEDLLAERVGMPIKLHWAGMESPKEYNFTTDRIFAKISEANTITLFHNVDRDVMDKVCEDHLASRSGFSSFYDFRWREWGAVTDWDHNQLSMLLYALAEGEDDDLRIYFDVDIFSCWSDAVDWPAVEQAIERLRIERDDEVEPDGRVFPPSGSNTGQYVAQYVKANNLKEFK